MKIKGIISTSVAVAAFAATSLVGVSSASAAQPTAPMSVQACSDAGTHYRTYNLSGLFIPTGTDWKSGKGGSVTSSIEYSQTANISISLGGTVSVSGVVASASATFGISAGSSATKSQTYAYTHAITAGKYGHVQFGNWGWKMNVDRYVVSPTTCNVTSTTTGTVSRMPSTNSWGFNYWETAT